MDIYIWFVQSPPGKNNANISKHRPTDKIWISCRNFLLVRTHGHGKYE